MFFQSSTTRTRHEYIEASLENAWVQLDKPDVIEALTPAAARLYQTIIRKLLYVVDVRHGEVKLPRDLDNSRIPVMAIEAGEEIKIDPRITLQTPLQSQETLKRLRQWASSEGEAVRLARSIGAYGTVAEPRLILKGDSEVAGSVVSSLRPISVDSQKVGKNNTRYFLGRPTMALSYSPGVPQMDPSTVVHEAEHIRQQIFSPVRRYDTQSAIQTLRLRDELEAYDVQAWFIDGLVSSSYEPLAGEQVNYTIDADGGARSVAARINNMRFETNSGRKDKFFPNGTLQKALEEIGLDTIYSVNVTG